MGGKGGGGEGGEVQGLGEVGEFGLIAEGRDSVMVKNTACDQ